MEIPVRLFVQIPHGIPNDKFGTNLNFDIDQILFFDHINHSADGQLPHLGIRYPERRQRGVGDF